MSEKWPGTAPLESLQWLECHIPRAADLLRELAASNGQALNASAIGRRLGLSCHAVSHRVALLEKAGLVRVLPSLMRGHSHVLLRDCRLVQNAPGLPYGTRHGGVFNPVLPVAGQQNQEDRPGCSN